MQITKEDLRERYDSLSTEELIDLRAKGTLTELALGVLNQVLESRGLSTEAQQRAVDEAKHKIEVEKSRRDVFASLSDRLLAQVLDTALVLLLLPLALFLSDSVGRGVGSVANAAPVLYLLLADGLPGGQSIGKRIVRIAVVDAKKDIPCNLFRSFLRNVTPFFLGVIDWVFIFGEKRQRLGDKLANTVVIKLPRKVNAP